MASRTISYACALTDTELISNMAIQYRVVVNCCTRFILWFWYISSY